MTASKTRLPTSIMADTVVWLMHAGRKVIRGAGSDIPCEPHMSIMRPLADLTALYRVVSVAKSAGVVRVGGASKLTVYRVHV